MDPDSAGRRELVAILEGCGYAVDAFVEPRTAFLFLLGRLSAFDGVLVSNDHGDWAHWLRDRVEMVSAGIPVTAYSGREPQREATIVASAAELDRGPLPVTIER